MSDPFRWIACTILLLASAQMGRADAKKYPWVSTPNELDLDAKGIKTALNSGDASLNREYVPDLLQTLVACSLASENGKKLDGGTSCSANWDKIKKEYFVIHVLRWKDLTVSPDNVKKAEATVDKQNWYVYHDGDWSEEDFSSRKRIFGRKRVWLIYIHLNRNADLNYKVTYTLEAKQKVPAYLDHLRQIGSLFGIQGPKAAGAVPPSNIWDAHEFPVPDESAGQMNVHSGEKLYVPSDLTFTPTFEISTPPGAAPKKFTFGATGKAISGPKAETFDNEGKYFFDFSIAYPIKKVTEFQYVDANGTLTPAKVEKQRLIAAFDIYPRPVDIKGAGFSWFPHFVGGFGIQSKPLQKALIGLGYGPAIAHFYFGLLLNTQKLPTSGTCGKSPTADQLKGPLENKTCREFSFGLNMGVGAIANALKSAK